MTSPIQLAGAQCMTSTVIALHCSLGSGRQWAHLAETLGQSHRILAPDIAGYGNDPGPFEMPTTLAEEVEALTYGLAEATGPIHLVGHSYGGAIAFKIATDSPLAHRVRSLTLIEPVLPTLLLESGADRRLHDRFVVLAHTLYEDLSDGHFSEAIDKFLAFWAGSGSSENISTKTRIRLIEHAEKLAFDFEAALGEKDVAPAAAAIQIPTLLFSGGLSPYLTQRIVQRLASTINGAKTRHLPAAGHMLPISHAAIINPEIAQHIAHADELAGISFAAG